VIGDRVRPQPFVDREAGKRIAEAALVAGAAALATKVVEAIWDRVAGWLKPEEPREAEKTEDDRPKS
jgi:hypothetical protein